MKFIKKYNEEIGLQDDEELTKKIDDIIDSLKYLLEDEGCELEYGGNMAWKLWNRHLTRVKNYKKIKNLKNKSYFKEYISRLNDELDKYNLYVSEIDPAQHADLLDLDIKISKK